jgi:hypothetical protein
MDYFKGSITETMKINLFEEQAFTPDTEKVEATPDMGAEVKTDNVPAVADEVAPDAAVIPEITDELVAELTKVNPAIAEVDPIEFKEGLGVEVEHFEAVGGDMNIVAKIVLNHLNEFPGKGYYAALATMESGLKEESATEPIEDIAAAKGTEVPAEEVVEEPAVPAVDEKPVEEAKDKKALAQTKKEK